VSTRSLALGSGAPTTLVVPGLGATAAEARIGASGLPGTRVVLSLPGHHDAPDPAPRTFTWPRLAADVLAAADACSATDAVGTSLGAGCLLAVMAAHPHRLRAAVLLLPAALDAPRPPDALDAALRAGDPERVHALVAAEVPDGVEVGAHVLLRTQALLRLRHSIDELAAAAPVTGPGALAAVGTRVLVIAATDDPRHPLPVARAVAAAIPGARLEVLDSAAPVLTHRSLVRRLTVEHLRSAARERPA
jgi:3-oxoadipate enol-lactonase